jgi:hypothetical protein
VGSRRSETERISSVGAPSSATSGRTLWGGRCQDRPHSVSAPSYRQRRSRGHANLAAEGPPPAKPATAAGTSSAGAAKQKQEEKNPHHADYDPQNRVVHMPLLPWLTFVKGVLTWAFLG